MPTIASRLFIDLVYRGTAKWANWEPAIKIEVGDYGDINRQTGEFERFGNIYTELNLQSFEPQLAPEEEYVFFTSSNVRKIGGSAAPSIQVLGQLDASLQGQWQFGRKGGALLAMARPQLKHLPNDFPYQKLLDVRSLARKSVVVNAFQSNAYALYLSQSDGEVISLNFGLTSSAPSSPGLAVGSQTALGWQMSHTSGFARAASSTEHDFIPMFALKTIKPRRLTNRRDAPYTAPPEGPDILMDTMPPWNILDEDGEEEVFDD